MLIDKRHPSKQAQNARLVLRMGRRGTGTLRERRRPLLRTVASRSSSSRTRRTTAAVDLAALLPDCPPELPDRAREPAVGRGGPSGTRKAAFGRAFGERLIARQPLMGWRGPGQPALRRLEVPERRAG